MMDKRISNLLKSSLPLEHQVAAIADECEFFNCGEFSYNRLNESGKETEFSVDLLISACLPVNGNEYLSKDISVLIECKYASPSVEWIFSRVPKHEPDVMSGLSTFHWIGNYLFDDLKAVKILEPQAYCARGVSLSTSSADSTQIKHGLQQLRYAIPNLLRNLHIENTYIDDSESMPMIVPILVTNAPIRILNTNVTTTMEEQPISLEDVTTLHSHVCVYQKAGPELSALCHKVANGLMDEFYPSGASSNVSDLLARDLIDSVESIHIISLNQLPNHLKKLRNLVSGLNVISHSDLAAKFSKLGAHES